MQKEGTSFGTRSQQLRSGASHQLPALHAQLCMCAPVDAGEATAGQESGEQLAQLHGCNAQAAAMDAGHTHTQTSHSD